MLGHRECLKGGAAADRSFLCDLAKQGGQPTAEASGAFAQRFAHAAAAGLGKTDDHLSCKRHISLRSEQRWS
jgi:hypothetical protein